MKSFDRKFGVEFMAGLPATPGVYRVFDAADLLVYVGKAKNLRRRIVQYRNAKRRKKHRKMRSIIADAARIEVEVCASELDACLLEARLIQELRPRWNVAGAFHFLYPMIGTSLNGGTASFCYTTKPEQFDGFEFFGAFRSRQITGDAFFALIRLLTYVGHRCPRKKDQPKYVYTFRQLPDEWMRLWSEFLKGNSRDAVEALILALVENAGARRRSAEIQEAIDALGRFFRHEARRLAEVLRHTGFTAYPVPQKERDMLFLRRRYRAHSGPAHVPGLGL